jgi:hypothetical protein
MIDLGKRFVLGLALFKQHYNGIVGDVGRNEPRARVKDFALMAE